MEVKGEEGKERKEAINKKLENFEIGENCFQDLKLTQGQANGKIEIE